MKLNKYLKELGLKWEYLPGNYITNISLKMRLQYRLYKLKRGLSYIFSNKIKEIPRNDFFESQAFDKRNKEDAEGFCETEFFSLDYSLALYIYPRLCKFRDEYASFTVPGRFLYDLDGNRKSDEEGIKEWQDTLNKMILAFKYIIKKPEDMEYPEISLTIEEGLKLFAEYYQCLWY